MTAFGLAPGWVVAPGLGRSWIGGGSGGCRGPSLDADAELALIALGYKQVDSRKAVRAILDKDPSSTAEALIRGALRSLQS
jgi:Holliday junction DNA helicase RuvA